MRISICTLALLGISAFGQSTFMSTSTEMDNHSVTVRLGAPHFGGPTVTGAPYSADRVSEHTQTLADGTHITQNRQTEHLVRDSQGRTRVERPLLQGPMMAANPDASELKLIEIHDPVAGYMYVIDEQNKVAHRFAMPAAPQRIPVKASDTVLAGQVSGGGGGGGTGSASGKMITPVLRPETSKPERLGSENIEGVLAEGTRTTTTWPINSQGNDRPMTDTSETWFSPELRMAVLSKNSSLRTGDNVTKLVNISRAEPDPSLMQPPAGFSIVDEKDSVTMTLKR
jgi:hypothetical protein